MLFNSVIFIFIFLPIVFALYYVLGKKSKTFALSWLVLASLFFYAWWNPIYLVLILSSLTVNFLLGQQMLKVTQKALQKKLFIFGIVLNLSLLGYFKYFGFFVASVNVIAGSSMSVPQIVLPLAISFFTFQQIAFLYDLYQGKIGDINPIAYFLFITFFPQLIAGPIVHHREMMPQFLQNKPIAIRSDHIQWGIAFFAIGLFKKVIIADSIAPFSNQVFHAAQAGMSLSFFEAWGGALAYTLQLYFDFSGYADMAIGAAYLFGIKLPLNFNSPYKATNISEFWRSWHITLERFLRECLYIPLGGNQKGQLKTLRNLMITMALGGLWHGAGVTFVLWGILHGAYLVVHQLWAKLMVSLWPTSWVKSWLYGRIAHAITLLCVIFGWVLFRAESLASAEQVYKGMLGFEGVLWPQKFQTIFSGLMPQASYFPYGGIGVFGSLSAVMWVCFGMLSVLILPNAYQYVIKNESPVVFKPTLAHAMCMALCFFMAFKSVLWSPDSEFLYFNF